MLDFDPITGAAIAKYPPLQAVIGDNSAAPPDTKSSNQTTNVEETVGEQKASALSTLSEEPDT